MRKRPSATALRAATRRAAHQLWDAPKVFDDPCCATLIAGLGMARSPGSKPYWESAIAKSTRALLVARARLAEDLLADAVRRGVRQFCILGAGLDTFACRNPYEPEGLRIFEVDHPSSQAWKLDALHKAGLRSSAIFAPVDFERQKLPQELEIAGWSSRQPTFFSCLGVASYLPAETLLGVLRFVRALPSGSEIVFDFPTPATYLSFGERAIRGLVSLKLALQGEAAKSRFDPIVLAALLRDLGLQAAVFDADAINSRYFRGRTDGLRMSNRSALIRAGV
jgi:methyltransferase (TIGR00027 family)